MTAVTLRPGEIWQDSEGALLYIASREEELAAFAFGSDAHLVVDEMRPAWRPAKRVFDSHGSYVGGGNLDYPAGHVEVGIEGNGKCPCGSSASK